LPPG
jgi:hypothetical protein